MWLSQAIIETLNQLPFWDSMVWTLSQKVLHPFPCFIERFSLNLRKPSDGFPNLIGLANGEILLEELLLDLSPRSNGIWFQRIQPILGLILEREWEEAHFQSILGKILHLNGGADFQEFIEVLIWVFGMPGPQSLITWKIS